MHSIHMFFRFARLWIQHLVEYRAALFVSSFGIIFMYGGHMFVIWTVVNRFERIGTWDADEVLLLLGMNMLAYGMAALFTWRSFLNLGEYIRRGTFDEFLIRPMSTPLYFIIKEFKYGHLCHILISSVVVATSLYNLDISFSVWKSLWFLIVILSGGLIQVSLILYTSIVSFWLVRSESFLGFFVWGMRDFVQYLISIYPIPLQIILTFVIPYAFINFYPSQYFLQKNEFVLFHPFIQFLSPAVGLAMFGFAVILWKKGLQRYQSTGT